MCAWLAGWSYRKTITTTGQAGAGTDYQVDFSIGDAAGGDFNLESHCTSFPNDIEVTDNDQTTPIDYWVEDLTVDPITMWVEVADDLGSNVDVCVYYGKSGATTESDGDATFVFFDDFPGSSLDGTKWDSINSPSVAVSSSIMTFTNSGSGGKWIETDSGWSDGHEAQFWARYSSVDAQTALGYTKINRASGDPWRDGFSLFTNWGADDVSGVCASGGAVNPATADFATATVGEYRRYKHQSKDDNEFSFFQSEGSLGAEEELIRDNASLYTGDDLGLSVFGNLDGGAAGNIAIDWCFLRKYVEPEPAFSSAGAEETPGRISFYHDLSGLGGQGQMSWNPMEA